MWIAKTISRNRKKGVIPPTNVVISNSLRYGQRVNENVKSECMAVQWLASFLGHVEENQANQISASTLYAFSAQRPNVALYFTYVCTEPTLLTFSHYQCASVFHDCWPLHMSHNGVGLRSPWESQIHKSLWTPKRHDSTLKWAWEASGNIHRLSPTWGKKSEPPWPGFYHPFHRL